MVIQTANEVSVILDTNYFFILLLSQHHCQYEIGYDALRQHYCVKSSYRVLNCMFLNYTKVKSNDVILLKISDSRYFNYIYIHRNGLLLFYFQFMLCGSLVGIGCKEKCNTHYLINSTSEIMTENNTATTEIILKSIIILYTYFY